VLAYQFVDQHRRRPVIQFGKLDRLIQRSLHP
jgi:hypothetical protein